MEKDTHERPHALPEHVHRDGREPAHGLPCAQDEERRAHPAREHDTVRAERRAVLEHDHHAVRERDDVHGAGGAVRVDEVRERRAARDDSAEVEHPAAVAIPE